jgi:hypothetical protein
MGLLMFARGLDIVLILFPAEQYQESFQATGEFSAFVYFPGSSFVRHILLDLTMGMLCEMTVTPSGLSDPISIENNIKVPQGWRSFKVERSLI